MSDVAWYAKGEIGERVLDVVEKCIDGDFAETLAKRELKFLGLTEEEVSLVLREIKNDSI